MEFEELERARARGAHVVDGEVLSEANDDGVSDEMLLRRSPIRILGRPRHEEIALLRGSRAKRLLEGMKKRLDGRK